jgi:hypothetical protein
MRKPFICILLALLASACQPTPTPVLPTLIPTSTSAPPTEAATSEVTETTEVTAEVTDAASASPSPSRTPSITPTLTNTPLPQPTSSPTRTPTADAASSATAAIVEAPRFSTITPAPPNSQVQVTTTPIIVADVVITEEQFQEELNLRLPQYPNINSAYVNFTPGGVVITLTASGGDALITGDVSILFQVQNGLVYISVGGVQLNAVQIPDTYAAAVNTLYQATIDTMDSILRERLGDVTDLENIVFTDNAMNITLLVPLNVATDAP